MGPGGLAGYYPNFCNNRSPPTMPQCWWFLCWCWRACWTPFGPGPVARLARVVTPGSGETPGGAEECMSTSEERRGAGNFTALPNIIYRSILTGRLMDHWRRIIRSVSSFFCCFYKDRTFRSLRCSLQIRGDLGSSVGRTSRFGEN